MDFHGCVIFMCVGICVNKVKAIYGRSRFNVKVYPRSTIVFTRGLSCIHCLYFICARKNYATVEIHPKRLKCGSRNRDDLLFIAKGEGRVSNFTKSLFVGRYNSFANRRGLGRVKEGFRFFPHLLFPLKIRMLYVLEFIVSKLFCSDQNFRNYSRTVPSTSSPLKDIV